MKNIFFSLALAVILAASCNPSDIVCSLQIYDIDSRECTTLASFPYRIEAPNWSPDGKSLIYNSDGRLYRINLKGAKKPEEMIFDGLGWCNNDHCISFDGKMIGISGGEGESKIFTSAIEGGEIHEVTHISPSYLHGWSPDGKQLVYCAERNGEYDIYSIPSEGGAEIRLTDAEGLDDGPEYTPDGKYIWFNSVRSGLMQLYRMYPDGSHQEQMTFDMERNSWFAHISPDGSKVVYITYHRGDLKPGEHLPGKEVELRLMRTEGGEAETVVSLYGGQGTINVNSWSPDSRKFAFVSYTRP